MRRGSIPSELLVCGGSVHIIFVLSLVTRCPKTIAVCMLCMFVFISVIVNVWGLWEWLLCSSRC